MKIKMLVSISGAGFALSRGDETQRFPEKDALNLIVSGAAVVVADVGYETASAGNKTTETAVSALNVGAAGPVGQEPGGSGAADNSAGENGADNATIVTGTPNAGEGDAGTSDQADTAQSAPSKGKGKAG